MSQRSSFTSSSDRRFSRTVAEAVGSMLWIVIGLAVIDIFIGVVFAYPSDPKVINPSTLQLYFDYGRSVEGKLVRETRRNPLETAPITLSGWYDPLEAVEPVVGKEKQIVTIYGMSHAIRLGRALDRTSSILVSRTVGAPGATANWSYGAYLRDRGGGRSRAVVLAFMSANLASINTLSNMTWNIDLPVPYTSDRFFLDHDQLKVVHAPYESFKDYTAILSDSSKWSLDMKEFAARDTMYNSFLMRESLLDHSSLFRLLRRAYAQRYFRGKKSDVLDTSGFNPQSEEVQVAQAIVRDFAYQARKDGMLPVIFIVNNFGYSDYLFRALQPVLEADHVPYVSSHTIVSPNDPRGYLPDSHFTDAIDERLAKALERVVENSELKSSQ
jgi:hypothetical protein